MSEEAKWWWMFALSAYSVVIGIVVWLRKPGQDAGSAVAKLREDVMSELQALNDLMSREVSELRNAQATLEERVEHMPGRDELAAVAGEVMAIKAEIRGLVTSQTGQTMSLNRIETYLLNNRV